MLWSQHSASHMLVHSSYVSLTNAARQALLTEEMTQKKKKTPKSAAVIHSLSDRLILSAGVMWNSRPPHKNPLRAGAPVLGSETTTIPLLPSLCSSSPLCWPSFISPAPPPTPTPSWVYLSVTLVRRQEYAGSKTLTGLAALLWRAQRLWEERTEERKQMEKHWGQQKR